MCAPLSWIVESRIEKLLAKDEIDAAIDVVFNVYDNEWRQFHEYNDFADVIMYHPEWPLPIALSLLMATTSHTAEEFPKRAILREWVWNKVVTEKGEVEAKATLGGL